ncbi:flagellar hook-length control protein FliK [Sulfurimonas indica]|uniref:flagellar hook-length control protein FliK n=1 Tax=Sulfurimonas indica TaxID=2508707 RepID=UPI0012646F22|nr:flagellar hook-length control protein FliK [Sulfurimonas indica]
MIAFDLTQETLASATGIIVEPKGEKSEGSLSFSALLKGIKESDELVQNGALVLSLNDEEDKLPLKGSKGDVLLSLLEKGSNIEDLELLEINPEVKSSLSSQDLKQLIKDAKAYLKDQILSSEGFKRAEIDMLPKTLKGLAQVAKKLGIDVSKITLDEVRSSVKNSTSAMLDTDNEVVDLDTIKKETRSSKQESYNIDADVAIDIKAKNSKKTAQNRINAENDNARTEEQLKSEQKNALKDVNSPLLFKVQKRTTISTEQIVHAKAVNSNPTEVQTPKKRADDTLKQLLQGEKVAKKEGSVLTSDFSRNSAKVIAPSAKSEVQKSLEALLKPETVNDDEKAASKVDGLNVAKADSFELKLNEAKQMIKYLSSDVKQAIENYKAPFTRVKVQLNPQQLGEIEVTVVQRGKNIHVNLSSNNAAINTLAMNANDLKMQLQNNGINNASLNFSNNSQGQDQAASQQQQQNREHAQNEYNYFENEETNEEVLSSLEIVVPHYA